MVFGMADQRLEKEGSARSRKQEIAMLLCEMVEGRDLFGVS